MYSCGCFNNARFGLTCNVAIDHRGGALYVTNCDFRKCTPTSELYRGSGEELFVVNTRTVGYEFPETK